MPGWHAGLVRIEAAAVPRVVNVMTIVIAQIESIALAGSSADLLNYARARH